jgi:dTDP-4-amino-4,6-dideoxygalactose transaminase
VPRQQPGELNDMSEKSRPTQTGYDTALMETGKGNIVLFHPHVGKTAPERVAAKLRTRWLGQGPAVDEFEARFSAQFGKGFPAVAVGSGTDALHLAYILAGVEEGDEVVTPVFTCTATNIPLLYQRAKVVFADVQPGTLNVDPRHVESLVSEKTKAIVCVHYGGLPCEMDELHAIARKWNIPVIEDAAHALGATYKGRPIGAISEYTIFSFQAIKHITTGDGGMLTIKDSSLLEKSKRIRWFGIDRSAKQKGVWENDINEVGYKYQMTDIGATMGLAALDEFDRIMATRTRYFEVYRKRLMECPGITFVGGEYKDGVHAAWLCTVIAENRIGLQHKLREHRIESNQVHYRNDRYTVFGGRKGNLPNMDAIEDKYLVLPLHTQMSEQDVERVCKVVRSGW